MITQLSRIYAVMIFLRMNQPSNEIDVVFIFGAVMDE